MENQSGYTGTPAAKPKRKGFDTGQEQFVGGEKYDPRSQWGSGPFPGKTTKFPDLPFEGYFMTGEQIAQAGPNYDPSYYSQPGRTSSQKGGTAALPQRPGKADYAPSEVIDERQLKPAQPKTMTATMDRLIQGVEQSQEAQKNLLARYKPTDLLRSKSVFA